MVTTINLTRAAIERGFTENLGNDQDAKEIKLEDNTFYKFSDKTPLLLELMDKLNIEEEEEAILFLGRNVLEPWQEGSLHLMNTMIIENPEQEE